MFKRTSLPVARSIHYQLIDIQLDEVQQMVHSNDGQVRGRRERKNSLVKIMKSLFYDKHRFFFSFLC